MRETCLKLPLIWIFDRMPWNNDYIYIWALCDVDDCVRAGLACVEILNYILYIAVLQSYEFVYDKKLHSWSTAIRRNVHTASFPLAFRTDPCVTVYVVPENSWHGTFSRKFHKCVWISFLDVQNTHDFATDFPLWIFNLNWLEYKLNCKKYSIYVQLYIVKTIAHTSCDKFCIRIWAPMLHVLRTYASIEELYLAMFAHKSRKLTICLRFSCDLVDV